MLDNINFFLNTLPGKLFYVDKNNYIKINNQGDDYNNLIIFDVLDDIDIEKLKYQLEYSKISRSSNEFIVYQEIPFKKWYKFTINPNFDTLGRLEGYSLYQENITEQKLLEQKVFETQFIYYEAFNAIGIGIWEYNRELKIFNVSNTLKNMLNLDSNVISLKKWKEKVFKEDWLRIEKEILYSFNNKSDNLLVNTYRFYINKDKYIWIDSIGKIIKYDKKNNPIKSLGIVQNITEHIEAKAKLSKYNEELEIKVQERTRDLEIAKKEAEIANVAKSEFISNISHEFFTPLNIILNSTSIIDRKLDDVKIKKMLENIKLSGENLNSLVKNMLYLSKLDINSIKFKFYKTDVINLLNSLILEVQNKYNINIKTEITTAIRYIYCDSINIKMVLLELINNSINYSDGDINIKILDDNKNIIFRVIDRGMGVNEIELKDIFNRFYTGKNSVKFIKGKGLGLSVCKEIIEKHNGKIWAENNRKKGLIVNFTLPILGG